MPGGIVGQVHRLTLQRHGNRRLVVLKHFPPCDPRGPTEVRNEAQMLEQVSIAELPAPHLLAMSAGVNDDGTAAILMSRAPGRVELQPQAPADWLEQIAHQAVAIHQAGINSPEFRPWIDPDKMAVPASATRPALWEQMHTALTGDAPATARSFIHRDFQHFNLLWSRGRLTSVVDWASACIGSPAVDVGHCMLNLTVLFDLGWAHKLRRLYETMAGTALDPWWELHAIASYGDDWPAFIPVQVAGRASVDTAGMTARVEQLIDSTLHRLV